MSGNTELFYKNRTIVTGIDDYQHTEDEKYRVVRTIGNIPLVVPDKEAKYNKGGLGWEHIAQIDPTFPSAGFTLNSVASGEYTFTWPDTIKRVKRLVCQYTSTASSGTPQLANPFLYFSLQNGDQALPRIPPECMTFINTAFDNETEDFTQTSAIKGYTSTLQADTLSTSAKVHYVDLTPMLFENIHTQDSSTKIYIKYALNTIANCCTSGASITISGVTFIFTVWADTDDEWRKFKLDISKCVRLVPYLYPFRIDIGSVTSSTTASTIQTIQQLSGRVPFLLVGMSDSGTTINQNSHIFSQMASCGFLDVNNQNLVFSWDISEPQSIFFGQRHGLSDGFYTKSTHVIPFIFCKDINAVVFEHANTGGMPIKINQQRIRILPNATATGSYECIVFGFYYSFITLDPNNRMVGSPQIVDA